MMGVDLLKTNTEQFAWAGLLVHENNGEAYTSSEYVPSRRSPFRPGCALWELNVAGDMVGRPGFKLDPSA